MTLDSSRSLANRILLGLVIGVVAGALTLALGQIFPNLLLVAQKVAVTFLDPLGQIFLRMLFFVVIPLVFASLASGVTQLGRLDRLGPLAGRTFILFFLNMIVGVALGLLMMNTLRPGDHLDAEAKAHLLSEYGGAAEQHLETQASAQPVSLMMIVEMFMPKNLLGAVVGHSDNAIGAVLPLILFAILVGAVGTQLEERRRLKLLEALDLVADLMTGIVHFALKLAPYAVPAMIYSVVVKVGVDIFLALGVFTLGCSVVMMVHLFGTIFLWLKFWAHRNPRQFFRDVRIVLVTAFSTSSSNATLPTSLSCAHEVLNVRPSIAGFVLPLGATMNMSGTALYEGSVVLFIAQVFGVELSFTQQLTLLLLSVLSAVAVAGIPGGSLPLIAGLLATFGIPPEGIGIVLGVDRLLDMLRTTVNVGFDLATAVIVDARVPLDEIPAEGST